ncbi:MAG: rRNA maturation RNase YbeY [Candidatus Zixiibacteriota bacterium]|nr:MAG: rRNA maturation RNase YbeY [candidate division Zixibacteria bacterium]
MKLNVFREAVGRLPMKRLKKLFDKLSSEEKKPGWSGEVNLIFTDDARIRSLNKQFRHIDKATDVLAFTIDQPESEDCVFGEVYVSVPTALRQAERCGATQADELVRLSCHGFLHLFGYDHGKKRDAEQMNALEEYYLSYSKRTDNG